VGIELAELLEVYDASGEPTGRAKSRGDIHRDGDWHLAFFCWIGRRSPEGWHVLLQERSSVKHTFPGRFDASSAGHVLFGESLDDAAREVREELGIEIARSAMTFLGVHYQQHDHAADKVDREVQAVHIAVPDLPDRTFRPDAAEVAGLAWAKIADLAALARGEADQITVAYWPVDDRRDRTAPRVLGPHDLVPYPAHYYTRLCDGFDTLPR
jgi:isopentenyldiphosphate isomerase